MSQLLRRSDNKSRPSTHAILSLHSVTFNYIVFPCRGCLWTRIHPEGACGRPAELRRIKAALRSKITHRRAFLARQSLVTMRSAVAILAVLSLSFGWLLGQFYKVLVLIPAICVAVPGQILFNLPVLMRNRRKVRAEGIARLHVRRD